MTFTRRQVERALQRKGFRIRENDHRFFIYHTLDEKKTEVRTKTSHGKLGADIADPMIGRMAKQCRLTKKEFENLIECPLSQEEYQNILVKNNVL